MQLNFDAAEPGPDHGSPEWHIKRRSLITATDISYLMKDSWLSWFKGKLDDTPKQIPKEYQDRGERGELWALHYGLMSARNRALYQSTRYPWLACTPDGIGPDGTYLVEIKTVGSEDRYHRYKDQYRWQVAAQVICMDYPVTLVVLLDEGHGRHITLSKQLWARDMGFIESNYSKILDASKEAFDCINNKSLPMERW